MMKGLLTRQEVSELKDVQSFGYTLTEIRKSSNH